MKKELPILIGLLVGLFAVAEFYVPHHYVGSMRDELLDWALVLTAGAYVIGAINILQVNIPKVRRRSTDWQYKVVLIAGAAVMALVGVKWHTFGADPVTAVQVERTAGPLTADDAVVGRNPATGEPVRVEVPSTARVVIETGEADALIKLGPADVMAASGATIEVPPGTHAIKIYMRAAGYTEVTGDLTVAAGEIVTVRGTPTMMWGPSGRVFVWIYDHIFAPANSTMFALLAFFVASAAFRAFRARNVEAALLLISAIIILIGRAPMGRAIHPLLPEISDWILDIPNNAGRRAIMMGAAIGAIATALRIILGLERSHLGSD